MNKYQRGDHICRGEQCRFCARHSFLQWSILCQFWYVHVWDMHSKNRYSVLLELNQVGQSGSCLNMLESLTLTPPLLSNSIFMIGGYNFIILYSTCFFLFVGYEMLPLPWHFLFFLFCSLSYFMYGIILYSFSEFNYFRSSSRSCVSVIYTGHIVLQEDTYIRLI